jgi:hypothetical protein
MQTVLGVTIAVASLVTIASLHVHMRSGRNLRVTDVLVSIDIVAMVVLLLTLEGSLRALSHDYTSVYTSLLLFSLLASSSKRTRSQYYCLLLCLPLILVPADPSIAFIVVLVCDLISTE